MRALISQGGWGMSVKFLFIGTHSDYMEESKDESIQDKNEKLKEIIMSFNMKSNVIYRGTTQSLPSIPRILTRMIGR